MRTTDERMLALKIRVERCRQKKEKQSIAMLSCASITLLGGLLHLAKAIGKAQMHQVKVAELCGSTLLLENAGGYVLVGVLSFSTAVVLTALCFKNKEKEKHDIHKEDLK